MPSGAAGGSAEPARSRRRQPSSVCTPTTSRSDTSSPSNPSATVPVAPITARACGVPACSAACSPGRSTTAVTTVPSSARAMTTRTSIRPHPVIQGASPSIRQPRTVRSALTAGGPGLRRYAKPMPARVDPSQSLGSHVSRAGPSPPATRRTAPWCCAHTKAVAPQPPGDGLEHGPGRRVTRAQAPGHAHRTLQAEQPRISEGLDVGGRHERGTVGRLRRGEEHVVGDRAGSLARRDEIGLGRHGSGDALTRRCGERASRTQRSTSPTTKKIDPRIEIRSGSCVPGSIAGITLTFENDGVRILRR